MITAVFFTSPSFLDHQETRWSMLRIPEVMNRMRYAQKVIEHHCLMNIDVISAFSADNDFYLRDSHMKGLMAAIVQLGLYDRYLQKSFTPHYLVGNSKGDSALNVASGVVTFEEMISCSLAVQPAKVIPINSGVELPILAGTAIADYATYRSHMTAAGDMRFMPIAFGSSHLRDISQSLARESGVARWVNIGPTPVQFTRDWECLDVNCVSSLDLDPMLSWMHENQGPSVRMAH